MSGGAVRVRRHQWLMVAVVGVAGLLAFGWPLLDRSWVNPSPNAPNLSMARAYAGTVMLEGATLSEGRGTTRPLELFGAPDIDARAVIAEGLPVHPIPGPSSLLAALCIAGLPADRVLFAGFLPPKTAGRTAALEAAGAERAAAEEVPAGSGKEGVGRLHGSTPGERPASAGRCVSHNGLTPPLAGRRSQSGWAWRWFQK